MNERCKKALPPLFFLLALLLRAWGIADNAGFRGDEGFQVPSALNYMRTGHSEPDNWIHPPLKNILLAAGMAVCGNNPYGWRMPNVILGSLTVMVLFLVAMEVFDDIEVAALGALFLAFDPLHIFYSRSNFQEIPAAFFFLLAVLLLLNYLRTNGWSAVAAGFVLGLAHAMKWYYVVAWIALAGYTGYAASRRPDWSAVRAVLLAVLTGVLPLVVYLATYYAWFRRGYGLVEFVEMQVDMFREMTAMTITGFKQQLAQIGPPSMWFVRPMYFTLPLGGGGFWKKVLVIMNNPPVWLLVLPSTAYLIVQQLHRRERAVLLLLVLFTSVYGQFLLTSRPVFLYSALAALPFALLIVAAAVVRICALLRKPERALGLIMLVFLLWSVMIYPLATGRSAPHGLAEIFPPVSGL